MKIEVSIGELVDKTTILAIRIKKIKSEKKLKNISKEYELLKVSMESLGIKVGSEEFTQLEEINMKLWDIEDAIRLKEKKKEFDNDFIQLARSIYFLNDDRKAVKREINLKYGSDLVEEKEYVAYKNS